MEAVLASSGVDVSLSPPRPYKFQWDRFQAEVAKDAVSLGATMSDSLSFMTDDLSEEVKKEMGHQVVETIPLCFFDGVPCNASESTLPL